MTISIICPLYNKKRYIEKTISSVVAQTSDCWELIIVDDDSTDGSFEIATRFSKEHSRIKALKRSLSRDDVRGANSCRNIGIRLAKGDYLIFLDADDVLMPHCVEQRLAVAESEPGADLYVFNVAYTMGYEMSPFSKMMPSEAELDQIAKEKDLRVYFLKKFLAFDLPWHTSGPLWRRDFLIAIGGFDESFQRLQDPEIHTQVLLKEDTKLSYQMGTHSYDVLHLKDEERVVWAAGTFFEKQIDAITMYINKFAPLIKERAGKASLKYLQGYLIFGETLAYRYQREESNRSAAIRKKLDEMYEAPLVGEITGLSYRAFLTLVRMATQPRFIKLKVAGLLLLLFKKRVTGF